MSFRIDTIAPFRKDVKKLIKKYPSLKNELEGLSKQLSEDPTKGTPLGNNCYKIRMAIKSKGKGKSGGSRVITHVIDLTEQIVYLLSIYDKSEQENILDKELQALLEYLT